MSAKILLSCAVALAAAKAHTCWLHRTVSDLQLADNVLGLTVAAMSVVSSSMQQIFCRTMQQKHNLSSHELLSNTAPVQVWAYTFSWNVNTLGNTRDKKSAPS